MIYTPKEELDSRIKRFQLDLAAKELDGAMIIQNADLFYFSGTTQQSYLYIPCRGWPILMSHRSYPRACSESMLECIVPFDSPRDVPDVLQAHGYFVPKTLGLEMDVLPANLYFRFREIFPETEFFDISFAVRSIRAMKSKFELAALHRAAQIGERTIQAMRELLDEGIPEVELAGKLEAVARSMGHQGFVRFRLWNNELFYGHLSAGKGAALPSYLQSPTGGAGLSPAFPQGPSLHKIRRGEPVLFDYVFISDGYHVDQTRIFAVDYLPNQLLQAQQAMLEIQDTITRAAIPGITGDDIYHLAVNLAKKLGYEDNFLGFNKNRISFVGHGVGLELDEYPFLAKGQNMPLEAGMVIAVEPKVIFPNLGAVGIENTFVITRHGAKRITLGPDEVAIL
jgi:Xaa-Pro aminopeptidase